MRIHTLALALLLPLGGCTGATIIELGAMGGVRSSAEDINDAGLVVGWIDTEERLARAVMWRGGSITELALPAPAFSAQMALAVNGDEQVVGRMGAPESGAHGFLWHRGTAADLGMGRENSHATDINQSGDVVGWMAVGPVSQALMWVRGTRRELRTVAGSRSMAYAVGQYRQAVGRSTVAEGPTAPWHAVLWANDLVVDLGTLGGRNSVAHDLTVARRLEAGFETTWVVGESETATGHEHAFVWNRGTMRDLGVLPGDVTSKAYSINSARVVVGFSSSHEGRRRACMWVGDTIVDLNTLLPRDSGWRLETATAINNRGQIVGTGQYRTESRGYLLTLP